MNHFTNFFCIFLYVTNLLDFTECTLKTQNKVAISSSDTTWESGKQDRQTTLGRCQHSTSKTNRVTFG